jgi:GNAT superfamily N-acetyltransferase
LAETRTWRRGEYVVTNDPDAVDLDVVHHFMSEESYWARGRTREAQARANAQCACFSIVHEPTGRFVGFGRVLSDEVAFAWVADVFVLERERGQGLGTFLITCIDEAYAHVARMLLGTRDAHGVYAKAGFGPIARIERLMEHWHTPPTP